MLTITLARWFVAITLYVAIISLLVTFKPAMLFHPDGKVKKWGVCTEGGWSVFSPQILFPLIAIIVYIGVVLVELAIMG